MTKRVFAGRFSKISGGTMTKDDLTLEDTFLHCDTCNIDTMHSYKGIKEQGKRGLTFIYTCKNCGGESYSDKKV